MKIPNHDLNFPRFLVKSYLDALGRRTIFKGNFPGYDWGASFLKRHPVLRTRVAENMKRARAKVSPEIVTKFFENLKPNIEGIPPENIMNYDESAFVNDPGKEKVLVRRGTKYPAKITEHSRVSVSVMVAGTASGDLLPPYVVYKSDCMWSTWILDGVHGARYNRTKSGWFDQRTFEDWFNKIALKYLKNLPGKKLMIGDNLASHLSLTVIRKCERHNIQFVLLPPNSTQYLQPLDVAVFRPLKGAWRRTLSTWKKNFADSVQYKENFPRLLKDTIDSIGAKGRDNLISGFRTCGLYPFSLEKGLSKIPQKILLPSASDATPSSGSTSDTSTPNESVFHDTLVDLLHKERFGGKTSTQRGRKKKIHVSPGKSVRGIHFGEEAVVSGGDSDDENNLEAEKLSENSEIETSSPAVEMDDFVDPDLSSDEDEYAQPLSSSEDEMVAHGEDPEPVAIADIKKDTFVIISLPYFTGSRRKTECNRKYLGQVKNVVPGGKNVRISYFKKYLNRLTDFIRVTPDNEEQVEIVPVERITETVNIPFKEKRGHYLFSAPIYV